MSNAKKVQEEELKKLEDQAYFELCQIIAEAMQYQDVELLNARIASWKTKYKKLLDRPSTNSRSDFKKRIEFLLNQYYSEVTKYILNQLKLNEEKKIENQAKAMRELYTIIRDTNDYDLLKKKVYKWKEKYPVSGFLKMYQKRIELYTRDKNIRENAFKQEEAFSDLVDVTKIHGTLDELKNELALWEEKYSINDKYSIDDFIKHQSEVKRFTSDEFLQSIAREEFKPDNIDKTEIDIVDDYNNSFSNLSVQASAYAALTKISKSQNSVDEMFRWVYQNSHIKFNDKYKELILSATYLDYSPTYLNKLQKPEIDMSKSSLSFDEYKNIDDIKRYAIISYFNLLLPPGKAISNDYFSKHIQTIYAKSERARVANDIKDESTSIEETLDSGIEISLKEPMEKNIISYMPEIDSELEELSTDEVIETTIEATEESINESEIVVDSEISESEEISNEETISETLETKKTDNSEMVIDLSDFESDLTIDLEDKNTTTEIQIDLENTNESTDTAIEIQIDENPDYVVAEKEETIIEPDYENEEKNIKMPDDKSAPVIVEKKEETNDQPVSELNSVVESYQEEDINQSNDFSNEYSSKEPLNHNTIVALSPLFFRAINNYDKQAVLIHHIDSATTKYVETEKAKEVSLDETVKTKNNLE